MKKQLFTVIAALCFTGAAEANNIQIANVSLSGQNTTAHTSQINFGVSWDNSWRTTTNESNYDGTWVFVKFRKTSSSLWQHATINYNAGGAAAAGHTTPAGATLQAVPDSTGVFVYRSTAGTGNVNFTGASLRWNYGTDGVLDNDSVEIRVYALEMVYCTTGSFKLGSGGTETGYFRTGGSTNPFQVNSEASINVSNTAGSLYYAGGSYPGDGTGPIPLAFPKGYNAFWMMKYECSQQQYADFLNSLDAIKAANRLTADITGTPNNYVAPYPERAAGGISVHDNLAFLDWAALRPMTEMEYEKSCRGYNITPVANEFAWGSTTIAATTGVYNTGLVNEIPVDGNANYGGYTNRPLRVGAYANDTTTTRTQTGGSYYGILELTGNVMEQTVTVGNTSGRAFTGTHGNGNLNSIGEADAPTWVPDMMGARGGAYNDAITEIQVSDRYYGTYNVSTNRYSYVGCRGVRTAQ